MEKNRKRRTVLYTYDDLFLTDGVDEATLENIEAEKYTFVLNKLGVYDNYYVEKLTRALVYMELAKMQLESDGMKAKYDIYKGEYRHFLKLATSTGSEIFTVKVGRS